VCKSSISKHIGIHGIVVKYEFYIFLFRLWRDVTEALKTNDIESATAAKHKVRHQYNY
jgi:hypothetical protein